MQTKLEDLTNKAEKTGLTINVKKTKALLRTNTSTTDPFTIRGESIEHVDSFTYLGSVVAKDGGTAQDVLQRIQKANGAFVQRYPVWKNSRISTRTKLCIFHGNVK
jgi:arabinogalactan endo-1,4-beta-galactosidase